MNAIPANLPFKSGIILPTALAELVDTGMIFSNDDLPSLQLIPFLLTASTVFYIEVVG